MCRFQKMLIISILLIFALAVFNLKRSTEKLDFVAEESVKNPEKSYGTPTEITDIFKGTTSPSGLYTSHIKKGESSVSNGIFDSTALESFPFASS